VESSQRLIEFVGFLFDHGRGHLSVATLFVDMYVDKHTGKHMVEDRVRMLLLTLPFLLRDLTAPEVCSTIMIGVTYLMA
jgi:hypothetical protein